MMIFLLSLILGALNALRGSGYIKAKIGSSIPEKWFVLPLVLGYSVYYCGAPVWLAVLFIVPYALKMGTGTGGDMQARTDNLTPATFNPHEFQPFDYLANFVANALAFHELDFEKDKLEGSSWHQTWGFSYCVIWGVIFTLPFIFTNYTLALPLLLYPVLVRYEYTWRVVEFTLIFWYAFLFLTSLGV